MRKGKKKKGCGKRVQWLDLPEFFRGPDEVVEILGRNTILVEGAMGIHTYEQKLIKIHMKGYLLVLEGAEFDLAFFENGCLSVKGELSRIGWEE